MNLLQELYDHPVLKLDKTDFQKRKRVKNVVPLHDRCIACRANGEQCTRRRKGDSQFCGTHIKGTPHGVISKEKQNSEPKEMIKKVSVWAQDIKNIKSTQNIFNHRAKMCTLAAQGKWASELENK